MSIDIESKWSVIGRLMNSGHRSVIVGGKIFEETRPSDSYNLPLVLAYALLDEILNDLKSNGLFPCSSWMLGAKI